MIPATKDDESNCYNQFFIEFMGVEVSSLREIAGTFFKDELKLIRIV